MNDKIYKVFSVISKAVDPEAGIYEAMISTEDVDRDGDIVRATGAKIENFLKNPVVLYAHNYMEPPVAKSLSIEIIPGDGLKARFQFPPLGDSEQADTVHRLWAGGFLNATSIGFIPLAWKPLDGEQHDPDYYYWGPKEFTSWELLEFSICAVPANQSALRLAIKTLAAGQAPRQKRGRVLSSANEKRIREAAASLQAVLDSLPAEDPEQEQGRPGEVKTVISYADHGTADEGESWSAPRLADFTDETWADLSDAEKRRIAAHFAWAADMPPEAFGDLKLGHHSPQKDGIGRAVFRGCAAAMGRLNQSDIPEGDLSGIKSHLRQHYEQFDKPFPEEENADAQEAARILESKATDGHHGSFTTVTVGCDSCGYKTDYNFTFMAKNSHRSYMFLICPECGADTNFFSAFRRHQLDDAGTEPAPAPDTADPSIDESDEAVLQTLSDYFSQLKGAFSK